MSVSRRRGVVQLYAVAVSRGVVHWEGKRTVVQGDGNLFLTMEGRRQRHSFLRDEV